MTSHPPESPAQEDTPLLDPTRDAGLGSASTNLSSASTDVESQASPDEPRPTLHHEHHRVLRLLKLCVSFTMAVLCLSMINMYLLMYGEWRFGYRDPPAEEAVMLAFYTSIFNMLFSNANCLWVKRYGLLLPPWLNAPVFAALAVVVLVTGGRVVVDRLIGDGFLCDRCMDWPRAYLPSSWAFLVLDFMLGIIYVTLAVVSVRRRDAKMKLGWGCWCWRRNKSPGSE